MQPLPFRPHPISSLPHTTSSSDTAPTDSEIELDQMIAIEQKRLKLTCLRTQILEENNIQARLLAQASPPPPQLVPLQALVRATAVRPPPSTAPPDAMAEYLEQQFMALGRVSERHALHAQVSAIALEHGFGIVQARNKSSGDHVVWNCTTCASFTLRATLAVDGWGLKLDRCVFEHTACEPKPRVSVKGLLSKPSVVTDIPQNRSRTLTKTADALTLIHGQPPTSVSSANRLRRALDDATDATRTLQSSNLIEYGTSLVAANPSCVFAVAVIKMVGEREIKQLIVVRSSGSVLQRGTFTCADPNHFGAVIEGSVDPRASAEGVEVEWVDVGHVVDRAQISPARLVDELGALLSLNLYLREFDDVDVITNLMDLPGELLPGPEASGAFLGQDVFGTVPNSSSTKELLEQFARFEDPGNDALQLKGIYLAMGQCIRAHSLVGSPVLGIDGGHLKSLDGSGGQRIKDGVTIVLSSLDSQRRALPLAISVGHGESTQHVVTLGSVLSLAGYVPDPKAVFVVDQGRALEAGLEIWAPRARILYCLLHIVRLIMTKYGGLSKTQMLLVKKAQAATTATQFAAAMATMKSKLGESAYGYLSQLPRRKWAAHTFLSEGVSLDAITCNNMVEIVMGFMAKLHIRHEDGNLERWRSSLTLSTHSSAGRRTSLHCGARRR